MNRRYYRAGAWLWIIVGVGHTVGDMTDRLLPDDSNAAFNAVLRDQPFEIFGLVSTRSEYTMSLGFSLATGLLWVTVGVLFLLLLKVAAAGGGARRLAGVFALAVSLAFLVVSAAFFPPPPIVFFALASLAFAAALWRRAPTAASQG